MLRLVPYLSLFSGDTKRWWNGRLFGSATVFARMETWDDLFERARAYGTTVEAIREALAARRVDDD
ncbi:hypothetical protein HSR122_0513 [Halapricum desulfuricans]|uniref:Uncharacterized protein n=1 Tax=Halapricum desulfuricans TaxID=2841257 RepID=A0A897N0P2_9EURY|nr:hypothetical protein HSR122_0513 [Halapricum desulfuricans]